MKKEKLVDEAAMFLERAFISGDTMIEMDHRLEHLPKGIEGGAINLHDLMANFVEELQEDKWISVEDELPKEAYDDVKDGQLGWLAFDGEKIYIAYSHPSNWNYEYNDEIPHHAAGEIVTHWKPLPKPPITNKPNKPKKRGGCNP